MIRYRREIVATLLGAGVPFIYVARAIGLARPRRLERLLQRLGLRRSFTPCGVPIVIAKRDPARVDAALPEIPS